MPFPPSSVLAVQIKKLFGDPDAVTGTQVCVFRVEDLTFKQHIYKVRPSDDGDGR